MTTLIFSCTHTGYLLYADPTIQRWSIEPIEGKHFLSFLPFGEDRKGEHFLQEVRHATMQSPTPPWELIIGTPTDYVIATVRGYTEGDHMVIFASTQAEELRTMQYSMDDLTSELAQAQRQLRQQNRLLQQALYDQRMLVRRLMKMQIPAIPIWDASILLSLISNDDDHSDAYLQQVLKEIWQRVGDPETRYIIIDMSSTSNQLNADIIKHLLRITKLLREFDVQSLLADAGSGLAKNIKQLGIDIQDTLIHPDIRQAIMHIGRQQQDNLLESEDRQA
jgi:anti-anti-sigma regulatory factor